MEQSSSETDRPLKECVHDTVTRNEIWPLCAGAAPRRAVKGGNREKSRELNHVEMGARECVMGDALY